MELRQLKHFLAVGGAGSITAAAKSLRITQPALSRQIKVLEEILDTSMLERRAHLITLTPAGGVLQVEARKLLRASEASPRKRRPRRRCWLLSGNSNTRRANPELKRP